MYDLLDDDELDYPEPPMLIDPVSEMQARISSILDKSFSEKFTPVVSKCGLGKTQGTKGTFRGMSCDSYWEAAWYIYQVDIQGNFVTRNTKDSFEYINADGQKARFYPDFKMQGRYHEIKGRFRENDILKKEATEGIVTFWDGNAMKPILKAVYEFNPKWRDEYIETTSHAIAYGKS